MARKTLTRDTCHACCTALAALEVERDQALRTLDVADHEVNRARARLAEVETKISEWSARSECRDHRESSIPAQGRR